MADAATHPNLLFHNATWQHCLSVIHPLQLEFVKALSPTEKQTRPLTKAASCYTKNNLIVQKNPSKKANGI